MFYVSDLITTSPEAFDTALQMFVYERFSAEGIPFERVDTDPGLTMDSALASSPWFACTDGTPTCFVKLRTRDLLDKYLRGREVRLI